MKKMDNRRVSNSKKIGKISKVEKLLLKSAVRKVIKEYGEALRMLGNR